MATVLLWTMAALLVYIYAGYPLLLLVIGKVVNKPVRKQQLYPHVSVIITAYNEAAHIEEKVRNILALSYPQDRLDVIVASDGSEDGTDDLVREMGNDRVRLVRVDGRKGKTACQNAAAAVARGEVLVFTDATTILGPDALAAMARNFGDPSVGCVAGRLVYVQDGSDSTGAGGTSYWNYEISLRRAESAIGSLIGVSGCLYAIRSKAYRPINPALISDFVITMQVREQGLRTVLEQDAVCYEKTLDRPGRELAMRVRVGMRSLSALSSERRFLNPLRYGAFAWQLWSHKLLRYLSPVFWSVALAANIVLAFDGRYVWLLAMQLGLLVFGLVGFADAAVLSRSRILAQPYYFLLTNLASAVSLFRFARGERIVTWTPVR